MVVIALNVLAFGLSPPVHVPAYLSTIQCPGVIYSAEAWAQLPKTERARFVEPLLDALTDCRRVGLRDTADLIIPYRIGTRELKFQGHGGIVRQDLFLVGGRAAWALSRLFETDLPELNGGLTVDQWAERAADIAKRVRELQVGAPLARKPE
jgi:hypothetical protein